MINIYHHLPAVQILLPFFGAIFASLSFNRNISWGISVFSLFSCFIASIIALANTATPIAYNFGGWEAPIGIEYKLDTLNQPIIVLINFILLFFLTFGRELIKKTILKYIEKPKQYLFYPVLLFAHVGYIGLLSSNDLFNIYVFIEISSLATYILISSGKSSKASIGALDYLVMGTIGATLILISIGFFLSITGSLNISDIFNILSEKEINNLTILAIVFFLTGSILKLAFFPMHFWMTRAYNSTAPFMLTYIGAISGSIGIYIMLRFMHFTIDFNFAPELFYYVINYIAIFTILICTFFAFRAENIKTIIIYSTCSQVGYIFLLFSMPLAYPIMFLLIILDALSKMALFTMIAHIQNRTVNLNIKNLKSIQCQPFVKLLIAASLIFSTGLPITSMFLLKVKIFEIILINKMYFAFLVIILSSVFSLLYHLKLAKALFFTPKTNGVATISTNTYGLAAIIILQLTTLIFYNDIIRLINQYNAFIV